MLVAQHVFRAKRTKLHEKYDYPAEALAKFWDELRNKARVEIDHPDLPDGIKVVAAEAIAEIWRQATAGARGELLALRVESQADQESANQARAQAEQAAAQSQAVVEQLRGEMKAAHESMSQVRNELEAERRAHAGSMARLQELHTQMEEARAQQQRLQEAFSADLAKAREAVDTADRRAAVAEKRALLEIEQERQARSKADKLAEALRAQVTQGEARERQAALEHAEGMARLQAQLDVAHAAHKALQQAAEAQDRELRTMRDQLLTSQQEATRYRTEARTVQSVLDRLTTPASTASRAPKRKGSP